MVLEVKTSMQPEKTIYGAWTKPSDKMSTKDIPALSETYYGIIGKPSGSILPFFVLSKAYNETTSQFGLFIGGKNERTV
ncbi:hypothetical protein LJB77_02905 [Ruminococcaceae bacterium OttesenSCG-928-N02]|nr:hypothetical protein [Ruminococcaceae bacterium OttesenSCG-928-N02]